MVARAETPIQRFAGSAPPALCDSLGYLRAGELRTYLREMTRTTGKRGMSWMHDVVDWVGGYPYEYASVKQITEFYGRDGFEPLKLRQKPSGEQSKRHHEDFHIIGL